MTILVQFTVNATNKAIAQREESYGRHSVQFNFKAFAEFFNNDLLVNTISLPIFTGCHNFGLIMFSIYFEEKNDRKIGFLLSTIYLNFVQFNDHTNAFTLDDFSTKVLNEIQNFSSLNN